MRISLKEKGKKILLLIDGIKEGLFPKSTLKNLKEKDANEGEIESIFREIIIPYAKEIVLRNLTIRDRTEKEIKELLKKRDFSERTISIVINDFKRVNLLDDNKTSMFIIKNSKGKSKNELRYKLQNMGVKEEIIEEALKDYDEKEEMRELIEKLAKKKKDRNKIIRYLISKGFDYENIRDVLVEIDGL